LPASYPVLPGGQSTYLLKEFDRIQQAIRSIQQIMVKMETNGTVGTKAGAVVAADVPDGSYAVIHDTVGATTKLYANIGGTLKSVALT
jgi:hypothetical protein